MRVAAAEPPKSKAWLVAYVDPHAEPPAICEAGIFPNDRPMKAERHRLLSQVILLNMEGTTPEEAATALKKFIAEPEWRWVYRVPVLTAGFLHVWENGRCRICCLPEESPARTAGGRDPDRCLVSHVGVCSGCGQKRPIVQGDALCMMCRYPSR
jgi:hypothetical protein